VDDVVEDDVSDDLKVIKKLDEEWKWMG